MCFFLIQKLLFLLHRYIEHGEYKENQYGTSIEAIRCVQAKNKMCIVDVQPEVKVVRLHTFQKFCLHVLNVHVSPGCEEAADNRV